MPFDNVRHVDDVPRWFTYLLHVLRRRQCRKVGHDGGMPDMPIYTCVRCGQIERELPDPPASP